MHLSRSHRASCPSLPGGGDSAVRYGPQIRLVPLKLRPDSRRHCQRDGPLQAVYFPLDVRRKFFLRWLDGDSLLTDRSGNFDALNDRDLDFTDSFDRNFDALNVQTIIEQLCVEFVEFPYISRTEQDIHAKFHLRLSQALPPEEQFVIWEGKRIATVQKEYPSAGALGKSRRQPWDIAVLATPSSAVIGKTPSYDFLRLDSVVEFGLNEGLEHLRDDIQRLCLLSVGTRMRSRITRPAP